MSFILNHVKKINKKEETDRRKPKTTTKKPPILIVQSELEKNGQKKTALILVVLDCNKLQSKNCIHCAVHLHFYAFQSAVILHFHMYSDWLQHSRLMYRIPRMFCTSAALQYCVPEWQLIKMSHIHHLEIVLEK